jgi:predicted DCC family thiol-disulfide oxidoreductase YuxK
MTPDLYRRCQRALQVRFADGRLLQGGAACVFILDTLGYRRLAALLKRWPCRWLVERGYNLVARHRTFFARFLRTRDE